MPAPRQFSFREHQIMELVAQAETNKEIAYELCLTKGTVKEYLHHIFRKLKVTNRTQFGAAVATQCLAAGTPDRVEQILTKLSLSWTGNEAIQKQLRHRHETESQSFSQAAEEGLAQGTRGHPEDSCYRSP